MNIKPVLNIKLCLLWCFLKITFCYITCINWLLLNFTWIFLHNNDMDTSYLTLILTGPHYIKVIKMRKLKSLSVLDLSFLFFFCYRSDMQMSWMGRSMIDFLLIPSPLPHYKGLYKNPFLTNSQTNPFSLIKSLAYFVSRWSW